MRGIQAGFLVGKETIWCFTHTAGGKNVLKCCTGDHLQIIVRRREGWRMISGWMLV
jgi:hypothetical protein